jgi:hypothetical protein
MFTKKTCETNFIFKFYAKGPPLSIKSEFFYKLFLVKSTKYFTRLIKNFNIKGFIYCYIRVFGQTTKIPGGCLPPAFVSKLVYTISVQQA